MLFFGEVVAPIVDEYFPYGASIVFNPTQMSMIRNVVDDETGEKQCFVRLADGTTVQVTSRLEAFNDYVYNYMNRPPIIKENPPEKRSRLRK